MASTRFQKRAYTAKEVLEQLKWTVEGMREGSDDYLKKEEDEKARLIWMSRRDTFRDVLLLIDKQLKKLEDPDPEKMAEHKRRVAEFKQARYDRARAMAKKLEEMQ
jgi:hypothetical protein